jgi:hypothetical protein
MSTPFEGLPKRLMGATIPTRLRLSRIEVEFMSIRSPISIDIKRKNYAGEYEIDGGILYVFFQGRSTSSAVVSPGPELVARLLLIDLIFQTPSWR